MSARSWVAAACLMVPLLGGCGTRVSTTDAGAVVHRRWGGACVVVERERAGRSDAGKSDDAHELNVALSQLCLAKLNGWIDEKKYAGERDKLVRDFANGKVSEKRAEAMKVQLDASRTAFQQASSELWRLAEVDMVLEMREQEITRFRTCVQAATRLEDAQKCPLPQADTSRAAGRSRAMAQQVQATVDQAFALAAKDADLAAKDADLAAKDADLAAKDTEHSKISTCLQNAEDLDGAKKCAP